MVSVRRILRSLSDLVLPTECAACGAPGPSACDQCARAVLYVAPRVTAGGVWARPDHLGIGRAMVLQHKSAGAAGHRSLTPLLGCLLADSIRYCVGDRATPATEIVAVPVPARRAATLSRGREPLVEICRSASAELVDLPVRFNERVRWVRQPQDQRSLGIEERRHNVSGATRARAINNPDGAVFIAIDDVVTTGATLRELVRALTAGGGVVAGCAAIVATPHR